jgi:EmrB/QacA subfamily drug resistance transporter
LVEQKDMIATTKSQDEQSNELVVEPSASHKWWAMLGIGMGVFIFGLDVNIVNLALPTLVRELHTSLATVEWVVLSYVLMLTVLVLGAARLGDMWSKKWLFLGGLIVFTISSLLCGVAPTVGFLIGFRVLQGFGAVFISALGTAIITEVFPEKERGRALGIIVGIFTLGIALGPTIGGLLMGLGSWRLIFLVNVPIGLVASLIVTLVVPSSVSGKVKKGFDAGGALLMTLTLTCFALGLTQVQREGFSSLTALIMLVIAAIGLGCFLVLESRLSEPMLDLRMFRSLKLSLSLLLSWMVYVVIAGVVFVIPFFLMLVKHYPPQQAGLLLAVTPVLSALMAPLSGTLSDRFGSRIISLIGLVVMAIGCLAISTFNTELTWLGYIVRIVPYGLGMGMFISPNNSFVMGALPQEHRGIASGLLSLSRTLGLMTGIALMGTLFATLTITNTQVQLNMDVTHAPVEALVFGMQMSFRVVALIVITSTFLAAFLWWLEQSKAETSEDMLGEQSSTEV